MPSARVVVVVNPTKVEDVDDVRDRLASIAAELGAPPPQVVPTDADDPGFGQTRRALAEGADLVCALGGDGTVRAVAQELVGSGVPLGLLPGGTGNLLARNVGAPVSDLAEAMRVALTGQDRTIDVGWLETAPAADATGVPERPEDPTTAPVHAFTVMAGLGFDALVMDDAPEKVKAVIGWAAYVVSGGKHLTDEPFAGSVALDGATVHEGPTRSVVVGNCGRLTGGITLLPEAVIDDGILDAAILTPESLLEWSTMAARVVAGRTADGPSITRMPGREVVVAVDPAQQVEVDGDVVGDATRVRLTVQPGGLVVRVPR